MSVVHLLSPLSGIDPRPSLRASGGVRVLQTQPEAPTSRIG
ncbi:hypothetical protein [Neomegalonema sp.]|nr:hypothetical protein [Neomegalonema sp.]MDD2867841.1 hypothetical protein [Neomegalonema sp.]